MPASRKVIGIAEHTIETFKVSVDPSTFGTAEISLDDYLATQGVTRRLDLLKIDVQGIEAKVRGARRAVTERKTKTYISSPAI